MAREITERRRAKQDAFNREHGIVPKTVIKSVRDVIDLSGDKDELPHSQKALSKKERETAMPSWRRRCGRRPSGWNSSTPPFCATASSSCGDMGEGHGAAQTEAEPAAKL